MTVFHGTIHNDVFNESGDTSSDAFELYKGGEDTVIAGSGDDIINLGASLDAGDRLNGGAGRDIVTLNGDYSGGLVFDDQTIQDIEVLRLKGFFDYSLVTADGNVAAGATLAINASRLAGVNHLTFNGSAETDGHFLIYGGGGNDVLTGGAKADVFHLEQGGDDTVNGGGGNDTFYMGAAYTSADNIDGNDGTNTLVLNGNYTATTDINHNVENVEALKLLGATNSYNIAVGDFFGSTITVDASTAASLTFDASGDATTVFAITGSAGNDVLTGGGGPDTFDLTHGGNDTVVGGDGDDTIMVGGAFDANDAIDGGAGNDTLEFNGDYSSIVVGIDNASIETFRFDGGHSYGDVTIREASASDPVTVDASQVSTLFHLTLDLTAYVVEVGSGGMVASIGDGGINNDTFIVTSEAALAASMLDAGHGADTLELNGDFSSSFSLGATVTNFEDVTVEDGHSYNLVTFDQLVAAGVTMGIDASALTGSNVLTFDGSAETDGHFEFISGAGADVLVGGKLSDTFDLSRSNGALADGGFGDDSFTVTTSASLLSDRILGGPGTDTLILNGDFSTQTALTASNIGSIDVLQLLGGTNSYNLTFADGTTTALTVDASAASSLTFSGAGDTTTAFTITGTASNDTIVGGAQADTITGGLGADTLTGGGGADVFAYTAAIQSTTTTHDIITDFDASADTFSFGGIVTGFDGTLSGNVSTATFDSDIGNAFNDAVTVQAHHAWEVLATGGDLSGHAFVVVDVNGDAQYSGGTDYVIDITGFTGTISAANFT